MLSKKKLISIIIILIITLIIILFLFLFLFKKETPENEQVITEKDIISLQDEQLK
jgi:flagellar basal body-associated protein FliL